jgi:cytochrome c2
MLRSVWSWRLPYQPEGGFYWPWCAGALLLALFTPSQYLNKVPFWRLSPKGIGQAMLAAAAFLALTAFLGRSRPRGEGARLLSGVAAGAVCYGIAYWYLLSRPDVLYGRGDFLLSAAIGVPLAFLAHMLPRAFRAIGVAALLAALASVTYPGWRNAIATGPPRSTVLSALMPLNVETYRELAGKVADNRGGAVERYRDSFLLVTGGGEFFVLSWAEDVLAAQRIALTLPPHPSPSSGDKRPDWARMYDHRVTDMVIDDRGAAPQVYVAHQRWNPEQDCVTLRVSKSTLSLAVTSSEKPSWTVIFETQPCLKTPGGFDHKEAGGRLAWMGARLLMTVGDFGLAQWSTDGKPALAQTPDASYGKVLQLDGAGHGEIFTSGHRNPQGLFVDREQRVWLTEHGPQGGDELNLVRQGRNYGYPLASYGTDYGRFYWSLGTATRDHGEFEEPIHVFTPSIGISNLIRVESGLFGDWKDDLLISSLLGESLYRVRLRGERVTYVEPVHIGQRIRDLAEGSDGRLVIWADGGIIVTLSPGPTRLEGREVYVRCRPCHDSLAPTSSDLTLRNVVGRPVAGVAGYPYSSALKGLGGTWTPERLDAFLADPDSCAPGSPMGPGRVPDAAERRAVIEFLKAFK